MRKWEVEEVNYSYARRCMRYKETKRSSLGKLESALRSSIRVLLELLLSSSCLLHTGAYGERCAGQIGKVGKTYGGYRLRFYLLCILFSSAPLLRMLTLERGRNAGYSAKTAESMVDCD